MELAYNWFPPSQIFGTVCITYIGIFLQNRIMKKMENYIWKRTKWLLHSASWNIYFTVVCCISRSFVCFGFTIGAKPDFIQSFVIMPFVDGEAFQYNRFMVSSTRCFGLYNKQSAKVNCENFWNWSSLWQWIYSFDSVSQSEW